KLQPSKKNVQQNDETDGDSSRRENENSESVKESDACTDISTAKPGIDMFNSEETDPAKSNVMKFSLVDLLHLYCPAVSRFVASLENDLTVRAKTTEITVKDFSSASYATIFRAEALEDDEHGTIICAPYCNDGGIVAACDSRASKPSQYIGKPFRDNSEKCIKLTPYCYLLKSGARNCTYKLISRLTKYCDQTSKTTKVHPSIQEIVQVVEKELLDPAYKDEEKKPVKIGCTVIIFGYNPVEDKHYIYIIEEGKATIVPNSVRFGSGAEFTRTFVISPKSSREKCEQFVKDLVKLAISEDKRCGGPINVIHILQADVKNFVMMNSL
ncbi:hypothetical protein IFM89_028100, partial [Coptis chinensis]